MSDTHYRSLSKAVTWRLLGTADTFIISWILTGEVALATGIAFTEIMTKAILYWFHERMWNKCNLGRITCAS